MAELIAPRIHQSELYGNFVEIGAGQPLAHELFSISGASRTINWSCSPYSRQEQLRRYGPEFGALPRSVSPEAVCWMLRTEKQRALEQKEGVNLIWVSSFQVKNVADGCSHGWIGYQYLNEPELYVHITFPRESEWTRQKVIREIGKISLRMLWDIMKPEAGDYRYLDGVFRVKDNLILTNADQLLTDWLEIRRNYQLKYLVRHSQIYWVVNPAGQWERLENQFRTKAPVLLYKGSFNPLHEGHLGILKAGQAKYPESPMALMISVKTYQKGEIPVDSLMARIRAINEAGYYVILTEKGMFRENIAELETRLPGQKWIYLLGWDTFIRMESDLFEKVGRGAVGSIQYLVFDRNQGFASLSRERREKLQKLAICEFLDYQVPISSAEIRQQKQSLRKSNV